MGWVGLEPTTNALKGRCSTIELPTRVRKRAVKVFPNPLAATENPRERANYEIAAVITVTPHPFSIIA
jgi:hypothetical protein